MAETFISKYDKTYSSFAGSDIVAMITLPADVAGPDCKPISIGNLQTISYSIHKEVSPVRTLGKVNPRGFTSGQRTIAGSMIFTMFDKNLVYTIQERILTYMAEKIRKNEKIPDAILRNELAQYAISNLYNQNIVLDMMPPFDIYITMRNEYGNGATIKIEGIVIVDEGQVMSIEDMITENTISYMAKDIRPLKPENRLDS